MGQYSSKLLSDSEEAKDSNGSSDVDQKVLVLGAGNFGCCLADHLASKIQAFESLTFTKCLPNSSGEFSLGLGTRQAGCGFHKQREYKLQVS